MPRLRRHLGECMLAGDHANHLLPVYPQRRARSDRACRRQTTAGDRSDGLLTDELPGRQERDGRLFSGVRYDGQLRAALLKVEHGVGGVSLREQSLLRLEVNDFLSHSGIQQEGVRIKCWFLRIRHTLAAVGTLRRSDVYMLRRSALIHPLAQYGIALTQGPGKTVESGCCRAATVRSDNEN